jgi:phage/plasmid-associated DNA primase
MLELKTKKELSKDAHLMAKGYSLVRHKGITYAPTDFETGARDVTPDPDRTVWVPLARDDLRRWASDQFNILFSNDGELASFDFMVSQYATYVGGNVHSLLVRTDDGLRELKADGQLHEPSGQFIPNTLGPVLNTEAAAKQRVFDTIAEWVDSEEEAHALLRHLASALAPGWSAVKYVLLLGGGRNGKSLLLKMVKAVFGSHNVSNVTRQQMAEASPVVCELNGKLLNLVFDGPSEYLKDSANEKSLVAGEPVPIRRLYESTPTTVQTNALFVEGLNAEPKSKDKSTALQKRIMRFNFPNVYALDHRFEKTMLSDNHLGAFLALLIDHFVDERDVAKALAPTTKSMELQLEHMFINSMGLQFIKHIDAHDALGTEALVGMTMAELTAQFQGWRLKENDLSSWSEPDVTALFMPILNTDRKGIRIDGQPRKVRVITSYKEEALAFIETLKGEEDDVEALVAD